MKKTKYVHETLLKDGRNLIINTITFDYMILPKKELSFWKEKQFSMLTDQSQEKLQQKNILIDDYFDQQILDRVLTEFEDKEKVGTPSFVIYVTNQCNLRCTYCYTGYELEERYTMISNQDIDAIFDRIEEICSEDPLNVIIPAITIFGGEPLLPKTRKTISYIFDKLKNIEYLGVEIVSNIMHIKEYVPLLKEFNEPIDIKVTINGDKPTHDKRRIYPNGQGTFESTLEHMKYILSETSNVNFNISVLLDKGSAIPSSVKKLYDRLDKENILSNPRVETGFGLLQFRGDYYGINFKDNILSPANYYPILLDIADSIELEYDQLNGSSMYRLMDIYRYWENDDIFYPNFSGCNAVSPGMYCFYPDKYIYPCFDCVGIEDFRIGNFLETLNLNSTHSEISNFKISKCSSCISCKYLALCNGGCLISNYVFNGSITNVKCEPVVDGLNNLVYALDRRDFFAD